MDGGTTVAGRPSIAVRTEFQQARLTAKDEVFELKELSVSYGDNLRSREISMDIYKNEVTALIGPSGCGKSTLIRCLNRMNDLIPSASVEGSCSTTARTSTEPRSIRSRSAS